MNVLKPHHSGQKKQATAKPKSVWRLVRSSANDNMPPVSYWLLRLCVVSMVIVFLFSLLK